MDTTGAVALPLTAPKTREAFLHRVKRRRKAIEAFVHVYHDARAAAAQVGEQITAFLAKWEHHFEKPDLMMILLVLAILVAPFLIDLPLLQQTTSYLISLVLGPTATTIAVLLVPAIVIALELWVGWHLAKAWFAHKDDPGEHGWASVLEWGIPAALLAIAIPSSVILTYQASQLPSEYFPLLIFMLSLSLAAHVAVVAGASLVVLTFRFWRLTHRKAAEERRERRANLGVKHEVEELSHDRGRAHNQGIELEIQPFSVPTQALLLEEYGAETLRRLLGDAVLLGIPPRPDDGGSGAAAGEPAGGPQGTPPERVDRPRDFVQGQEAANPAAAAGAADVRRNGHVPAGSAAV